jgi:hypothetical protein
MFEGRFEGSFKGSFKGSLKPWRNIFNNCPPPPKKSTSCIEKKFAKYPKYFQGIKIMFQQIYIIL